MTAPDPDRLAGDAVELPRVEVPAVKGIGSTPSGVLVPWSALNSAGIKAGDSFVVLTMVEWRAVLDRVPREAVEALARQLNDMAAAIDDSEADYKAGRADAFRRAATEVRALLDRRAP